MILTILRHGQAEALAASDRERRLTAQGQADIPRAAAALDQLCLRRGLAGPTRLMHSPWLRTTQTATLVGAHFGLAPQVCVALAPGRAPTEAEQSPEFNHAVAEDCAHLVVVSHQPLVSLLLVHWLGQPVAPVSLSPGGFNVLEATTPAAGCATLLGSALPPTYDVLR